MHEYASNMHVTFEVLPGHNGFNWGSGWIIVLLAKIKLFLHCVCWLTACGLVSEGFLERMKNKPGVRAAGRIIIEWEYSL